MQPRPVTRPCIDTHELIRTLEARSEELASSTHQGDTAILLRLAALEIREQAKQLANMRGA